MSYTHVDIQTHLDHIEAQIAAVKQKGQYAGHEQHWDGEVVKIVHKDCAQAEYNVKINAEVIENQRRGAQGIMNDVERALKQKDLSDGDYLLIEQAGAGVQKCIDRIAAETVDLTHANVQYRGNWQITAQEALSPHAQAIVDPYLENRKQQIDVSRDLANKKKRCEEYLVRAHEFAKQAQQRKNKGGVEVETFNQDCEQLKTKIEAAKAEIEAAHTKKKNTIKTIKDLAATKVWPDAQKKLAPGWMNLIAADAKAARGKMKTLTVLLEGLEKRGKTAGSGWKELAAESVKKATTPYKEAVKSTKAFDEDEDLCRKICKNHGVNA
jgi:hypothetical protein